MPQCKIYVLELERGKYYIGRTEYEDLRIIQHNIGKGAAWTSKFPPLAVIEVRVCNSPFEEDMVTKEYMAKFGVDNVRGGSYVKIVLDSVQVEAITRELLSISDACKTCGKFDHFMSECNFKKPVSVIENSVWRCEFCNITSISLQKCIDHEDVCSKKMLHSTLLV